MDAAAERPEAERPEALSVAPEPTADALRRRIGTTGLALGDGTARKFTASGAGDGGDAVCSSVEIWGADAVRVGTVGSKSSKKDGSAAGAGAALVSFLRPPASAAWTSLASFAR